MSFWRTSTVIINAAHRHLKQPYEALAEVWGAVLASTLTTLAVFVPVLFTQEEAGQLFRDIALAISAAVGLSLMVAVTLIPMASARLLAGKRRDADDPSARNLVDRLAGGFVQRVVRTNQWLLAGVVRRLAVVTAFVAGSLLVSWFLFPDIEYLPDGKKARIQCKLHTPPGYHVGETEGISREVFEKLLPYWEIEPGSPEVNQLDLPPLKDLLVRATPGEVMVQVQTEDPAQINDWLPRLRALGDEIPGMRASAYRLSLFPGSSRKIDIELTGPDVDSVITLAQEIQTRVEETIPDAQTSTIPGLWNANPELHVTPYWDRVAELGIDAAELGYVVDTLTDGAYVADYSTGGEKIDLRIIAVTVMRRGLRGWAIGRSPQKAVAWYRCRRWPTSRSVAGHRRFVISNDVARSSLRCVLLLAYRWAELLKLSAGTSLIQ